MMTMYLNRDGESSLNYIIRDCIQPDVFEEPIIREAMEDIEEIYKIEGLAFYSKRHGVKSPESLSNGMKTLILLYYNAIGKHNLLMSSACLGNNCYKYLARLSLRYDFNISVDYSLLIPKDEPFLAKDYDSGKIINNKTDLIKLYGGRAGLFNVS